jgi:capsid protein
VLPTVPADTGLSDFSRIVLQMYSVATGIPYEALTQDYGSMSFSTAKIKRTDLKNEIKPAQRRFIRWQCQPIMEDFFKYGILSGYLDLSEAAGLNYTEGIWQPPGFEPVDPLREVKAVIEEIKAGLRSPQEYIRTRGGDPEEVLAEISEFKSLSESYGLNFDAALTQASTMMANAPSKIDNDGEANEQG